MGTVSILTVIKLAVKSGIFIVGCIGVAGAFNWMNKKQFTLKHKGGAKHDHSELDSEIGIGRH